VEFRTRAESQLYLFSGTTKLTGSAIPSSLKNRPRIPTPDVTREMLDGQRNSVVSAILPTSSPTPLDNENLQETLSPPPLDAGVAATSATRVVTAPTNELPAVVQVENKSIKSTGIKILFL